MLHIAHDARSFARPPLQVTCVPVTRAQSHGSEGSNKHQNSAEGPGRRSTGEKSCVRQSGRTSPHFDRYIGYWSGSIRINRLAKVIMTIFLGVFSKLLTVSLFLLLGHGSNTVTLKENIVLKRTEQQKQPRKSSPLFPFVHGSTGGRTAPPFIACCCTTAILTRGSRLSLSLNGSKPPPYQAITNNLRVWGKGEERERPSALLTERLPSTGPFAWLGTFPRSLCPVSLTGYKVHIYSRW